MSMLLMNAVNKYYICRAVSICMYALSGMAGWSIRPYNVEGLVKDKAFL